MAKLIDLSKDPLVLIKECNDMFNLESQDYENHLEEFITHYENYDKVIGLKLEEKEKKELADIKESLSPCFLNATESWDKAAKVFSDGRNWLYYKFFERLQKNYKALLVGVTINIPIIIECLQEIEQFEESAKEKSHLMGLLEHNFRNFIKIHVVKIKDFATDSLTRDIENSFNDCTTCESNFKNILNAIKSKLMETAARLINRAARTEGLLKPDKVLTKPEFLEALTSNRDISKNVQALKAHALQLKVGSFDDLLFNEYNLFNDMRVQAIKLDKVHTDVKRVQYVDQTLANCGILISGFCLGDIRRWGLEPFHSKLTEKSNLATYEELNVLEYDARLYELQTNQLSEKQTSQDSECLVSKVVVGATIPSSIYLPVQLADTSQKTSDITSESEKKQQADKSELESRKMEARLKNKDWDVYIDNMLQQVVKYAQVNSPCTIEVGIRGQEGHAIGFKVLNVNEELKILFRDPNRGVFYTENLKALQYFLKFCFCLDGYHEKYQFKNYDVTVIQSKQYQKERTLKERLASVERGSQEDAKILSESGLSTSHLVAFVQHQSKPLTSTTMATDDEFRSQLQSLLVSEDYETNDGIKLSMKECYDKILNKTLSDDYCACIALLAISAAEPKIGFLHCKTALGIAKKIYAQNSDFSLPLMASHLQLAEVILGDKFNTIQISGGELNYLDHLQNFCVHAMAFDFKKCVVPKPEVTNAFSEMVTSLKQTLDKACNVEGILKPKVSVDRAAFLGVVKNLLSFIANHMDYFFTEAHYGLHMELTTVRESIDTEQTVEKTSKDKQSFGCT